MTAGRKRVEAFEEGREEVGGDAHVAVEQDDDVVFSGGETAVGAAAEAVVLFEFEDADLRVRGF